MFIVREGLAKWCYVETGLENEAFVEILDSTFDLKPGELVITSGHYTLVHDGAGAVLVRHDRKCGIDWDNLVYSFSRKGAKDANLLQKILGCGD